MRHSLTNLAFALIVVSACDKTASESTPSASAAVPAEKPARPVATVDLCSLVTKSEAEAILGKSLAEPQKQPGGDCWYMREGGKDFGDVELILSIIPAPPMKSTRDFDAFVAEQVSDLNNNLKKSGLSASFAAEPAPGVGAPAYFIDPGLYVLKNTRILAVALGGEKGVAIAKTALPRMP